jgi:translation initiation factor 2 beta subunit (eIF-2beta)/eIF-5
MSQIINVAGLRPIRDPDYRYRTEAISVRNEGKGKGRTLLTNITTIAKYIKRDHSEILKFFGLVFGAQTFDEPNSIGLKGFHTADEFQRAFCTYVEYFVICPGCRYPCETTYEFSKSSIYQMCDCCGTRSKIDPAQGKIVSKMITVIMASQKKMEDTRKEKEKKDMKLARKTEAKLSSTTEVTKPSAEIVSSEPSASIKFKCSESCQGVDTSGDESETAPTVVHEEVTDEEALGKRDIPRKLSSGSYFVFSCR